MTGFMADGNDTGVGMPDNKKSHPHSMNGFDFHMEDFKFIGCSANDGTLLLIGF